MVPCPAGGLAEGEAICADEYIDSVNGGCFAANPAFSPIDFEETVCGESGVFVVASQTTGDFDWYEVTVPVATELVWSVQAEFPPRLWIFDGNSGCEGAVILAQNVANECDGVSVSAEVDPGSYWVVTGPAAFTDSAAWPSGSSKAVLPGP